MNPSSSRSKPPNLNTLLPRFSKDLVKGALLSPQAKENAIRGNKRLSSPTVQSPERAEHHSPAVAGAVPRERLQDVRSWLNNLADQEQENVDWTPEYTSHGRGTTVDEEMIGLVQRDSGLDTKVLKSISLGLGPRPKPRPPENYDLLAPFRKAFAEHCADSGLSPYAAESYLELLSLFQYWNEDIIQKKYGHGNRPGQREELLQALEERIQIVMCIQRGDCPKTDLRQSSSRLLRALHAFRPETVDFDPGKTPVELLTILVANRLVMDPDHFADPQLWDTIFKAIWAEAHLQCFNDEAREKNVIEAKLESAHRIHNTEEVERLTKAKKGFKEKGLAEGARTILSDIKRARENLYKKILWEVAELTAIQIGQRCYLESLPQPPFEVLEAACNEAHANVERVLRQRMDMLEAGEEVERATLAVLKHLNEESLSRVRKFAGLDVARAIRERAVRERLQIPETAVMMLKVKLENATIREHTKQVIKRLTGVEDWLDEAYEACRGQLQVYGEMYNRFDIEVDDGVDDAVDDRVDTRSITSEEWTDWQLREDSQLMKLYRADIKLAEGVDKTIYAGRGRI